ncbi:hypothetical protein V527_19370 [Pseudomonas aeruginosa VRFPA06]|nr:hypothetical protein V527_19370 [Pseudomonas aeruginosa VRFPA06]
MDFGCILIISNSRAHLDLQNQVLIHPHIQLNTLE